MASESLKSNFEIPLVDFSKYLHGSALQKQKCVEEIMKGFTTSGFLYLQNSGLSPAKVYDWSSDYFALPLEEKQKHLNNDKSANRGYSGRGVEKVTNLDLDDSEAAVAQLRAMTPDLKESLEIASDAGARYPAKHFKNHYPDEALPGFGAAMTEFYQQCDDLHHWLLSAIAEGLSLDKDYFKKYVTAGDHVLRLLHYPSVPKVVLEKDRTVRAGSHTDYGTVTLLFQDMSGGLQAKTPEGSWQDIPPIKDAIVINAGDMLQIWTNDVIKSTHHRVMSPPNVKMRDDGFYSARYSIAFFAHPDHERVVNAIETCISETQPRKYPPVLPGEWMVKRLTATH